MVADVAEYDLRPIAFDQLVDWSFADFQWRTNYDHISDTTKLFRAGFTEMVDDEEMMVRMIQEMQEQRVLP